MAAPTRAFFAEHANFGLDGAQVSGNSRARAHPNTCASASADGPADRLTLQAEQSPPSPTRSVGRSSPARMRTSWLARPKTSINLMRVRPMCACTCTHAPPLGWTSRVLCCVSACAALHCIGLRGRRCVGVCCGGQGERLLCFGRAATGKRRGALHVCVGAGRGAQAAAARVAVRLTNPVGPLL